MDPVTAIGLVSGVLTFSGAAGKTIKSAWSLYKSVEGSSDENKIRLELMESMKLTTQQILPTVPSVLNEEETALVSLAQRCQALSQEMQKRLQNLKPKRRKSIIHSFMAAVKTLWMEHKIKELESQLQECRNQVHFEVARLSRYGPLLLVFRHWPLTVPIVSISSRSWSKPRKMELGWYSSKNQLLS